MRKFIIGGVAAFAMVAVPTAVGVPLGTAQAGDYGYLSGDNSSCSSTWTIRLPAGTGTALP